MPLLSGQESTSKTPVYLEGMLKSSATFKALKATRMVAPILFLFNSPVWTLQKLNGSKRTTVDYCRFRQVEALIATSVLDMVLLLE